MPSRKENLVIAEWNFWTTVFHNDLTLLKRNVIKIPLHLSYKIVKLIKGKDKMASIADSQDNLLTVSCR